MTEFNECTSCGALTTPARAKDHAADHAHTDKRIDALTRANTGYLQEVAGLKDDIAAFGRTLAAHPISADPETIVISPAPDFDPEDLIDDEPTTDPDPWPALTTVEPSIPTISSYAAIDRDDDYPTTVA